MASLKGVKPLTGADRLTSILATPQCYGSFLNNSEATKGRKAEIYRTANVQCLMNVGVCGGLSLSLSNDQSAEDCLCTARQS